MVFRHILVHADLGTLVIPEPDGFRQIQFTLTRNPDFKSLWETFDGEFMFYGIALDRIREAIRLYGPDTTLEYKADVALDGFTYQKLIVGQLALDGIEDNEDNTALVPIIKTDLTTKFKNRYDTPVDLLSEENLDGTSADIFNPVTLDLPSQLIQKTTTYNGELHVSDSVIYEVLPDEEKIDEDGATMLRTYYTQTNINLDQDEIPESFDTILDWVTTPNDISPCIEMLDESGVMTIVLAPMPLLIGFIGFLATLTSEPDPSVVDEIVLTVRVYLQKNAETPIEIGSLAGDTNPGGYTTPIPGTPTFIDRDFTLNHLGGSITINVSSGDTIKVYNEFSLLYNINVGANDNVKWENRDLSIIDMESDLTFTIQSSFPDSVGEAFLIHDAAGQIADRIIGEGQVFYSELLGSDQTNYRQYDANGCQWRRALIKGLQLRNYSLTDKPFFLSFKQWWEGINPILNLGLGYETIDGEEVLRVEGAEEFFNDTIIVRISNVKEIKKSFDPDQMVKTVRIGYKQWQSDNISGIDDAQTKHTYASRLQKFGKDVTIESDFIGASLAIETTRRTTRKKSADYKFDDNTFIIALSTEQGSPSTNYLPELDEHFTSITNLRNPETRYNSIDTPARMFMRWAKSLFGGLQHYVGSVFKFTAGEGNYDMTSNYAVSDGCGEYDAELSEKQDIEVTDQYIHRGELCTIKCKLDLGEYLDVKNNRKNALGISQTNYGHLPFHIKELGTFLEGETTILAWAVRDFVIKQVESPILEQICFASEEDCTDAYLTEDNQQYVTQDDECLVLN